MKATGKSSVDSAAATKVFPLGSFLAAHPERASDVDAELCAILENAPIGIHWVDAGGIIVWANRTELEMLGYSRGEYVGRPIADFHVDADVIADILRRLKQGDTLSGYEARLRRKDGTIRIGAIDSNVLWSDGKFVHSRCFTRDITEEIQFAQSAEARLADLENIYRTAPVGLALVDRDLRFVRVNERLAQINGVPAERHIGRTVREIIPDLAGQAEQIYRQVLDTGSPVRDIEFQGETAARPGERRNWNAS